MLRRAFAAFFCTAFGFIILTAACGTPLIPSSSGQSPEQSQADAAATNVRRTAVAQVQQIIANNPTPTVTPGATAIPRPSCQGAIWWHEARSHLGEIRTIQGPIVATRPGRDGLALLELGQPYPDPVGVAVMVTAPAAPTLEGKTVCVAGRIMGIEGRPTLQIRDASTIVVVN